MERSVRLPAGAVLAKLPNVRAGLTGRNAQMVSRCQIPAVSCSPQARRARFFLFLLACLGSLAACGEGVPQGPTAVPAKITGHVYQWPTAELGEPMLADVLITIEEADGAQSTTRTNAAGFYTVSATRGIISISATKAGYQTNSSQFELSSDTVLNFSLVPDAS